MPHVVLGLNAFHADSAAALVIDGQLVAAAEEERFRRIKHWAGFPSLAINYCLDYAGLKLSDVSAIAVNTDPKTARGQRLLYAIKQRPSLSLIVEKIKTRHARLGVAEHLKQAFPGQVFNARIVPIEHHLAHLASAFYCSPFDKALAVSVDGMGDFASGAFGIGEGTKLSIDEHVYFPHSLGIFYQAMTQFLGFMNYGDEYKVMGLAPYGKPVYVEVLKKMLGVDATGRYSLDLQYFRHHTDSLNYQWDNGEPKFDVLYSTALPDLLGPAREPGSELTQAHRDMAASIQAVYEDVFFQLLNGLYQKYPIQALTLAGGCAQNSVANGKITRNTPFTEVYVAASGADAGGAVGAALMAAVQAGQPRTAPMLHGYWGNAYDRAACEAAVDARIADIEAQGIRVSRAVEPGAMCDTVVERICLGHVIGWFQGRMEWGPRALGNRSIIADPRRSDIKDILNLKIKRRESFRPFAPSILREHTSEWFEMDADVPFMAQVFPIIEAKRALIPAVAHVDGSGRLQTVRQQDNPLYHQLISTFCKKTGVPILLNTSFNENEPVVCRPEEALDCFLRTKMDVLALGDCLLQRV